MLTRDIMTKLMAFDTVSSKPNVELIEYVQGLLQQAGVQ